MSMPTDAQISAYSSLDGTLKPRISPYYELPQDVYHEDARTEPSPAAITQIPFHLSNGIPCVPLDMLLGSLRVLERNMVGASDYVFAHRVVPIIVHVRVMWPGYAAETMSLLFISVATTRATLAQCVAHEVDSYMKMVSRTPSILDLYQIGPKGIQSRQVLLGGITHMDNDTWEVKIFIDNTMNTQA